jgi:hypothetical protein
MLFSSGAGACVQHLWVTSGPRVQVFNMFDARDLGLAPRNGGYQI